MYVSFTPRRPGFDNRSVHVDRVAFGQVSLQVRDLFPVVVTHPTLHIHPFIYHRSWQASYSKTLLSLTHKYAT